jgi:hypothetical protein
MKFLDFLSVARSLCCHVHPGTLAASTWSIDVFDPRWLSFCLMDPRCCLSDLFSPLFSEHERYFGI